MLTYFATHNHYLNFIGIAVVIALAWCFSKKRTDIDYRLVLTGLTLQFGIGFLLLKGLGGATASGGMLHGFADLISSLYRFADEGAKFIFGNLSDPMGSWGFIFGIKVLPIIIFFGALMSLLFYLGVVQFVVNLLSYVVRPLLGTSGAETLCAIANSFLGQTEAPLLIRHYLKDMTKSELFVVMVSGMATVSGAIMAVFAAMGVPAQHILVSALMAIPGSLVMAKMLYPETEQSKTATVLAQQTNGATNVFDAISSGTVDGLSLAMNVGAMLIVFISLIALVNALLSYASVTCNVLLGTACPELSLGLLFGYLFRPFAYLLGFTGQEALQVAKLLGTKVTINELVAFSQMTAAHLSARTQAIMTYALCGFSNFSCIGIQVGGIGALVPEKRRWLTELGLYAVLGSSLANLLSALMIALLV